tara:strand:- start:652 stop:918 length:267 start_codon:yes stop_codon:yes gene_type:complete
MKIFLSFEKIVCLYLLITRKQESIMKSILTGILSLFIFFGTVPTANASDMNMAGMEEVKKKKKKKGKKIGKKGKKAKKGFFSKVFGSK